MEELVNRVFKQMLSTIAFIVLKLCNAVLWVSVCIAVVIGALVGMIEDRSMK